MKEASSHPYKLPFPAIEQKPNTYRFHWPCWRPMQAYACWHVHVSILKPHSPPLEFTSIHSKLWDAVSISYHYLGYMTVSPSQTLLVFKKLTNILPCKKHCPVQYLWLLVHLPLTHGVGPGSYSLSPSRSLLCAEACHCITLETTLFHFFFNVMIRLSLFYRAWAKSGSGLAVMSAIKGTKETSASIVPSWVFPSGALLCAITAFMRSSYRVLSMHKSSLLEGRHFEIYHITLRIKKLTKLYNLFKTMQRREIPLIPSMRA